MFYRVLEQQWGGKGWVQPFAPKPAESLILAGTQWLTWPFLSFELQVWPEAHPDVQLPTAGRQWLRHRLQPHPPHLHGLPLPVRLQHLRHYPEHGHLE